MFKFVPLSVIQSNMPEIRHLKVSPRARSTDQFLDTYRKYGANLPPEWALKRSNFIKRTYAAYQLNPTRRRQLALLVWAFAA